MQDLLYITNINQFVSYARLKPQILSVGSLRTLKDIVSKPAVAKAAGCSKCGGKGGEDLSVYRPQFDSAMAMLSPTEQQQLKSIIGCKQLCYYRKNPQGQLKKECF